MKIALTSLFSVARLTGWFQPQAVETTQLYAGTVANYPISLTVATSDNLIYGTLIYTRSRIPIRVVGTLTGASLLMHEFDKQGTITGTYMGTKTTDGYAGTWHSPARPDTQMPFSIRTDAPATEPTPVRLTDLTGTYAYSFGPRKQSAMLSVQQTDSDRLLIAIRGGTGDLTHEQARPDMITVKLTGNQAICGGQFSENSRIKFTFFNGGVCVDYVEGFAESGAAATITGNYVRIDSALPTMLVN